MNEWNAKKYTHTHAHIFEIGLLYGIIAEYIWAYIYIYVS